MNWRRLIAMLRKESYQIVRDPSTVLIAVVLPIVLIFLFGYAVNLDTSRTRIGLALQDQSEAARSLSEEFQRSPYFLVARTGTVQQLGEDLAAGRIRGIVVLPSDFGKAVAQDRGTIQVITDGAQPNTASFVSGYAMGIQSSWTASRAFDRGLSLAPPVSLEQRYWFNPGLKSRYFLVPGAIAIVMSMIGSLLTGLVIAREWERGTMEAILATPLNMGEFIAVKVLPYFALGLVAMTICTVLAITVFGVPFRGSPLALIIIGSCFLVPALGQGLFISATTKNQFVASQISLLAGFMPSIMLSGFIFEIASMPKWVQALTYIVPSRYLIPQLQTVFIAGDDWRLFLPDCAILLGFGVFFFLLSIRVTKRRVA